MGTEGTEPERGSTASRRASSTTPLRPTACCCKACFRELVQWRRVRGVQMSGWRVRGLITALTEERERRSVERSSCRSRVRLRSRACAFHNSYEIRSKDSSSWERRSAQLRPLTSGKNASRSFVHDGERPDRDQIVAVTARSVGQKNRHALEH